MSTAPPSIAAVVVNYNTTDDLRACVTALADSGVQSIDVLDNCSTDLAAVDTLRTMTRVPGVDFRAHFSDVNLGFGGGINRLADGVGDVDYLWIVNPDVVVTPHSAKVLVSNMREGGFDLASPVIETGEPGMSEVWFAGGNLHVAQGLSEHILTPPASATQPATFLTGAALCVSMSAWRDLGGFRDEFFLYWEDADLVLRAAGLGYTAAVVSAVTVWHRVGASGEHGGKSENYYYFMNRNRLILCGAGGRRLDVLLGHGWRFTLRLLASALREQRGKRRKLFRSLRGIFDGLRYRDERVTP
ncbi:glycosyl transferase [Rhodococcoides trifolii]|uniref:Glycosyl transferase n=1 Tax=Rhodococcoides trifolii TaxID=908250 RepID=A0A917G948_9NOCA|nr:glycosyltransferase family 2 protein [Rhodococcus trifolii]GGG29064.1 glycosyl transferase [Rhodococcus trifolii]